MPRCPTCPLAGDPGSPCVPALDWPGWCKKVERDAHQPEHARYWADALLDEADKLSKTGPVKRPEQPFPPAPPRDGRVRAGVLSPCCYLGGADIWVGDLLRLSDKSRIQWLGAAIRDDGMPIIPEVRASWEAHCPVAVGPDAIRALAAQCDVLVAWGVFQSWGFTADPTDSRPGLADLIGSVPLLYVSHGSDGSSLVPPAGRLAGATAAGVAPCARRGMPEAFRGSAHIILNQISPERVARTRTPEQVRAEVGIPPGAKVAGWVSRFASEKRPEVFVDAVANLPPDWIGVAAGIGYGLDEAMRLADEVAPGRIRFLGGRHDIGDLMSVMDCLCMPSVTEACSLTAGEGWLAGCPLISTPVGLLEDHPGLARLVPQPPTADDLASAILADDADKGGTAARALAAQAFAREEMAPEVFSRKWSDLICSLAPERIKPRQPTPGLDREIRLTKLRRECPHGTKVGCGCADELLCSKNGNSLMGRRECFACLEATVPVRPA